MLPVPTRQDHAHFKLSPSSSLFPSSSLSSSESGLGGFSFGIYRMCISISFCLVCECELLIVPVVSSLYTELSPFRNIAALRYSLRVRRKPRLAGKGGRPDGMVGSGSDTDKSSVHRNVQRLDQYPHPTDLHPIPERFKSQRGREREPPVIIGDPTVSFSSAFERKATIP